MRIIWCNTLRRLHSMAGLRSWPLVQHRTGIAVRLPMLPTLMVEVARASEHHRYAQIVSRSDHGIIVD